MADFDDDFAVRHAKALHAIGNLAGLEYLPVLITDETRDGKLLVFESGTNMIVHSMDSPELFPYKKPQMDKVFRAFQAMLQKRSGLSAIALDLSADEARSDRVVRPKATYRWDTDLGIPGLDKETPVPIRHEHACGIPGPQAANIWRRDAPLRQIGEV